MNSKLIGEYQEATDMGVNTTADVMANGVFMMRSAYKLAASRRMACEDDISLLAALCSYLDRNATIVQLGAGSGTMALATLAVCPYAKFLSIDIDQNNIGWEMKALENAGYDFHSYNPILGLSWQIGFAYKGPKVDLLIVDADHRYRAVRKDLVGWAGKVKATGNVFVHDYDGTTAPQKYPGVKRACDEVLGKPWYKAGWSGVFKYAE